MLLKRAKMIRTCSEIGVQNMAGFLIREKDLRAGDISALQEMGYHVYGMRQPEGMPYTIERKIMFRGSRAGIAVFRAPIIFPKRKDMAQDSMSNYYTMNNQYSWFDPCLMKKDFAASVNRPRQEKK